MALRTKGTNGAEAVSISVLPDFMSAKERAAALGKSVSIHNGIDTDPNLTYKHFQNEDNDEEESKQDDTKEYVFVIDRSGSMYYSIKLARRALKLFLQSLPYGSKFNIVSYGSKFQSMFAKSVEYDEKTLKEAVDQVE